MEGAEFLKVAFIGAGGVNFGGPEGPWDHASRLEKYCGDSVAVTAIVEPDVKRAESVLQARRSNPRYGFMYSSTKILRSVDELLAEDKDSLPDAVFIGLPPLYHGSSKSPYDIEMRLAEHGIHMLVEKPISCHPLQEVQSVNEFLSKATSKDGKKLIVSVGYMLRYSNAVRKMEKILQEHGGQVLSTVARYNCTYTSIQKASWWDRTISGGPIVEQCTHLCDLSRLFGGDVDESSVIGVAVGANEKLGELSAIPVDEGVIKPENRIPRTTSAVWKYKNGAIGSLNHGLLLHGQRYQCEFEVWGDGIRLVLIDPYSKCKLLVRKPGSDDDEYVTFEDEDMYLLEMKAFIDAIRYNNMAPIRSSYNDACGSYALSYTIAKSTQKDKQTA